MQRDGGHLLTPTLMPMKAAVVDTSLHAASAATAAAAAAAAAGSGCLLPVPHWCCSH
jgi:hypothetical protein